MIHLIKKIIEFLKKSKNQNAKKIKKNLSINKKIIEKIDLIDKLQENQNNNLEIKKENLLIYKYILKKVEELKNRKFEKKRKKYMLVIDDNLGMITIIQDFIELFEDELKLKDIEIKYFSGKNVSTQVMKFIEENIDNIYYGIIDISLNERVTLFEDQKIILDGIDLAIIISELQKHLNLKNVNFDFVFYTGNVLNEKIDTINKKIQKFKLFFNYDLKQKVIQKDFLKRLEDQKLIFKKLNLLKDKGIE